MKKLWLILGLSGLVLLGLAGYVTEGAVGKLNATPGNLKIKISLNQTVYKKEDPVGVAILIFSGADTTISFPSAKIYDLILETGGKKVWQWSDERMFAQSFVTKEIKTNEPLLYCEVIDPLALQMKLPAGEYTLTPVLCLKEPANGTPVHFVIK